MAEREIGSIEKRGPDKYRLRVFLGYDDDGNRIRPSKTVTAKSDRRAYAMLDEWIDDLKSTGYVDASVITVKHFFENMWKKQAPFLMQERTYHSYQEIIQARIIPKFGKKILIEIKPYEIRDFVLSQNKINKPEEPLSRQSRKRIIAAFSSLYNIAWSEFRIAKDNPCVGLKLPAPTKEDKIKKGVQEPYSISELELMFKKLENQPLRTQAVVLTGFVSSAREGEIAALERKHFLMDDSQILFEQRIIKVNGEPPKRIDGLKNGDQLLVDVPSYYIEVMKSYLKERDAQRQLLNIHDLEHDYVFGHIDGRPISPATLYRVWEKFVKSEGLRMIRFHDLRHTAASYLISNPRINSKAVQEHLGHSNFSTTMDMYVHALKESKKDIANEMGKVIHPNK